MTDIEAKERLEAIHTEDQRSIRDFRAGKITDTNLLKANDKNLKSLLEIVSEYGIPTITKTSHTAYKAAVLVALHSGDLELMKKFLSFLSDAETADVDKPDLAYMIDKLRVLEGKPQVYGTQFKKKGSAIEFLRIEDPDSLDERRKALGMESFSEYKRRAETY